MTVIGHSEIVGKPIAFLLMAEGATVTVCHHLTREVALHSRAADAVLIAVGKPGLLKGDMIRQGSAVIDIGINQVKDDEGKLRIVGDCDYNSCQRSRWLDYTRTWGGRSGDSCRADAQYGCCCRSPQRTIPRANDRPSLDRVERASMLQICRA